MFTLESIAPRSLGLYSCVYRLVWLTAVMAGPLPMMGATSLAAPPISKLNIRWQENGQFWYKIPRGQGGTEFVWVDPHHRRLLRAETMQELEALVGNSLGPASGALRIEPSESGDHSRIEVQMRNDTSGAIQLYWVDLDGRPRPYGAIEAGALRTQSTFVGHSWVATTNDRTPIWTGKANADKEVLSIRESAIEPTTLFDRRDRSRRRNGTPETTNRDSTSWRFERQDHNLRFLSPAGESFDTASIPECAGSVDSPFDQDVHWSPNQRFAFTLQTRQGEHREVTLVESSPRDQLQPRLKKIRYDKPGDRLDQPIPRLFDLETRRAVPIDPALVPNPWSIDEIRWSPDSSRLTFLYNQRGHQVLRLIAVDPISGTTTTLIEENSPTYIDYASKAMREYLDGSSEILWGSERDGWYHVYRFDLKSGTLLNRCTHGEWVVRSIERIDQEKRRLWFYAGGVIPGQDPYYRQLCRVDFDGSNFVLLTQAEGDHECQFDPAREWLIDTYSRVDMPPVHELRSAITGEMIMELERSETAELWPGTSRPERFVAQGRDGKTDIYGVLVRPTHMEPGKRYPIIENIYAGPQDSFVPKAYSGLGEYHALADQGFVVVKVDGMGTSNRSKAFQDVSYRNLADGGFPDRKLWIQAAASHFPEMDVEHVGIYGGSAGGQNALAALLFHSDFYDAAVADCGCHDNRMDKVWWNELYMGWPVDGHYEANSNVVNAHRLVGKLMLVVGELDSNVDPSSTMQVVDALIRADKDFDLIYVPGGEHGIGSSPYCKRRRDAFFARHLQVPTEK